MKEIAVIHIGDRNADESLSLLGQEVCAHLRGTGGDADKARALIAEFDGRVDCIALDGLPASLYPTRYVEAGQLDSKYPIVVAGKNFGCGSSREHAPIAMGSANCEVVLAESFARIFFRNCVATGELYPCELTARLCDRLKTGDVVTVDLDAATVKLHSTGETVSFKPLGDVRPVVDAGGLFNYARSSGMIG